MFCVSTGTVHPTRFTKRCAVADAWGDRHATYKRIQEYCDEFIGVDCSGFVSNYLSGEWNPCQAELRRNADGSYEVQRKQLDERKFNVWIAPVYAFKGMNP